MCTERKNSKRQQSAQAILLYRNGHRYNIKNSRLILSHLDKFLTKFITSRLTNKIDLFISTSWTDEIKNKISTYRELFTSYMHPYKESTEFNVYIHFAFLKYQKAFDSLKTWAILKAWDHARVDFRYWSLIKYAYIWQRFYLG